MKKTALFTAISLLGISNCYAIFCPNNFNQIYAGQTMAQVEAVCGKPDKETSKDVEAQGPQEWSYFMMPTAPVVGSPTTQGSLKTQFAFDASGRVINISVNGIGVGGTAICGTQIQLFDAREKVKAACGNPTFINKQSTEGGAKPDPTKVTEYNYGSTTLVFENGKLTERK